MKLTRKTQLEILASALAFGLCGCSSTDESTVLDSRSTAAQAGTNFAVPRSWPHMESDIPVDSRIEFGNLDNGLRWAWASNSEPEERCYIRLHVDVGSLAEEEHERGMAHFLEHMAFNGSKNFPAGTLIEWFQAQGMAFGADTNAHTSFSETVYKLDLPTGDEASLREGLLVLRDFADGLLLEEQEVEAEKGVIDGEERERDSAGMRVAMQQLETVFAGTRIGERLPIGTKEARDGFSAQSVRAFYERWYRPENMTLVAVGDLGDLNPEALFEEFFGSMTLPDTPWVDEPGPGQAADYSYAIAIHESEIPSVSITVERLEPWVEDPLSVADWLEDMPMDYARSMLNLRFSELAKSESAPFLGASVARANALEVFDGEALSITCAPERWQEALPFCEQELRRAIEFGFQEAELAELRADALRGLDEAVEREPTAHSRQLLTRILRASEESYVPTNARTRRDILRPAIEALTVEDCHRAFRQAWSEGELSVSLTGNLDLGEQGGEQVLAAYRASTRLPVEKGAEIAETSFAYGSSPENPGRVVWRNEVDDLGITQVRFENGVALNLKATDFKEQQILLSASVGEGRLTLDPEQNPINWVGSRVFTAGGLGAHSADELRRVTAGKQVGVGFAVTPDDFQLSGATTSEDLLMECELMCAYLQDPGWREDGLVQMRRQLPLMFDAMKHQHQGPMSMEFYPALFDNDPRFGTPELEVANSVEMEDVRKWLAPELSQDALEISLVGDLDIETAIEIAARTFGKLPGRREWREFEERRVAPAPKSALRQTHEIETEVPKSLVLLAFPIPDGIDPQVRRVFRALDSVVNDRLRLEVRERLGAAYSPGAGMQQSQVHPGVGLLFMQAMADPEKVDVLVDACLQVAGSLASEGITDEEVERLREPILATLRDSKRTNAFWLGAMSRSQRMEGQLDEVRSADAFYESYTAADLTPYAAEFLKPELASILIVNPKTKP